MEYENEILPTRSRTRIRKRGIVTGFMKGMDHFDFTPYEGQLVRVDRDKVYLVKNGKGEYVSKLPLQDGRGWESVREVGDTEKKNILQKAVEKLAKNSDVYKAVQNSPAPTSLKVGIDRAISETATDAPKNLLKSVAIAGGILGGGLLAPKITEKIKPVSSVNAGGEPVKTDIVTTAVTSSPTNSTFADKILQQAQNAAPELKEKVIQKGQEYLTDKLGDITRSPEMLPKTKELKDAERYAEMGGYQEPLQSSLSMGFDPKYVMIGVALLLGAMFIFKQNS